MTSQEKNAFGCMGVVAVVAFVWLSALVVGGIYEQAFHPEKVEQRRQATVAKAQKAQTITVAQAAVEAAKDEERRQRDLAQRDKENGCIREIGYEACRRIYQPTPEERAGERAVMDRADRVAEAYSDQ